MLYALILGLGSSNKSNLNEQWQKFQQYIILISCENSILVKMKLFLKNFVYLISDYFMSMGLTERRRENGV